MVSTPLAARIRGRATTGVPGRQLLFAAGAVLGQLAGELVPEDHRLLRAAEAVVARALGQLGPVVDAGAGVEVRAADAAAQHGEADLPLRRLGFGPVDDLELGVLADDSPHPRGILPPWPSTW